MVSAAAAEQQPPDAHRGVATIQPRWAGRTPGAPQSERLPSAHIHLWAVDLADNLADDLAPRHSQTGLLTASEVARAGRYRDRARRAMYLGGRIGLRRLLGAYTGIANDDLRFVYGGRGKPVLANPLPGGELCFNYTLSGGRALYALAWNRQVGIDMETWPRKINAARLARRKLAPAEQRAWHAVPAPWRDRAMLACWTRKEAYGKALGVGIRYAINQAPVCVCLDSPAWQCAVTGLFDSQSGSGDGRDKRILHGLQLALPFPGIAALVHDGNALASPAAGVSLRGWQLRDPYR